METVRDKRVRFEAKLRENNKPRNVVDFFFNVLDC